MKGEASNWFYRLICGALYVFLKLFYRIEIKGLENLPKGACIVAPSHTSFLDPPIIGATCPDAVHSLAKASLFKNPIFGAAIRKLNSHPVQGSGEDMQALRIVIGLLKEGDKVLIFPEGARSPSGELMPLKLGAAMMAINVDVPIVPVAIEGAYEIWKKGKKFPSFTGKLKVTYLPPIYPAQFRDLSKKEAQQALTEAVFQSLKKALSPS
jgi:1-acyl-sn-glycerol-3-phosphate acyltransferase